LTAAVIAAVLASSYLAYAYLFDLAIIDPQNGLPMPVDGGAWTAFVLSLIAGYSFSISPYSRDRFADDLAALEPVIRRKGANGLQSWTKVMEASLTRSRIVGAAGLAFGLALWGITALRLAQAVSPREVWIQSSWFLVVVPLVGWQIARAAYFTVLSVRSLSRQAEAGLIIDLLDLSGLAPLARMGLRNAFTWIIGSTLVLLLFLNIPVRDAAGVLPGLVTIVALAVVALAVPVRRANREIVRAKRSELMKINVEIREDLQAMRAGGSDAAAAAARLPGLIAYRTMIASVREWPLDLPMLTRFSLYLLIPLAGWFGGAMVERLIDALLD
jgi:hypothetical protein